MTAAASASVRERFERVPEDCKPTPWPLALLCGVTGGVAAVLAFPPYDLWMLLPVALALLSAGLLVRSWPLAALVSLLWGLGFFVPLTQWANIYAGAMPWLALAVFQSLFIVAYGLLARTVLVRRGLTLTSAIVISALWVGVEALRGTVPWGGLTWGASGFALAESPLLNLSPWIGMAGLAFVVALIGQTLLHGVLALLGRRHRGLTGFAGVWPLALVMAGLLATLVVPLPVNRAPAERSTMTIAGIQGSMDPIDPVTIQMPEGVFENHLAMTDAAIDDIEADGMAVDLLVWPEDSTSQDPREAPGRASALQERAQRADAPILVGTQTPVGDDERLNNSLLITPDGEMPYVYAKRHPVPFGEYVPARELFRKVTDTVDLVGRDMIAGDEIGTMDLAEVSDGEGTVGILICFEVAYEYLVTDLVDDGAEVIVVQSNNALFGDSHEAIQQLAQAKVMAVLSGRSVVHVSTVGDSAIFTPEGRQLDVVDHWDEGYVLADVPLRTGTTPAIASGPWIAIALGALGAAGWLGALTTRRRALARPRRTKETTRR